MNNLKYIVAVLFLFLFFSCGEKYTEVIPDENESGLNVKLEFKFQGKTSDDNYSFTMKLTNTGTAKLTNCSFMLEGRYFGPIVDLLNTTGKNETAKILSGDIKPSESITIVLSRDNPNIRAFRIDDKNFKYPKKIELFSVEGIVKWTIKEPGN